MDQNSKISEMINTSKNHFLDTNRIKAYFPVYSQGNYFNTILDKFIELLT